MRMLRKNRASALTEEVAAGATYSSSSSSSKSSSSGSGSSYGSYTTPSTGTDSDAERAKEKQERHARRKAEKKKLKKKKKKGKKRARNQSETNESGDVSQGRPGTSTPNLKPRNPDTSSDSSDEYSTASAGTFTASWKGGTNSAISQMSENAENIDDSEEYEDDLQFQLDPEFDVSRDHLQKVFRELDKYNVGQLTFDQLYEGLADLWSKHISFTDAGFKSLLESYNTNNKNTLSEEEFISFVQEVAASSVADSGELSEAFVIDYNTEQASCRFLTLKDEEEGCIRIADLMKEPRFPPEGTYRWLHIAGDR